MLVLAKFLVPTLTVKYDYETTTSMPYGAIVYECAIEGVKTSVEVDAKKSMLVFRTFKKGIVSGRTPTSRKTVGLNEHVIVVPVLNDRRSIDLRVLHGHPRMHQDCIGKLQGDTNG